MVPAPNRAPENPAVKQTASLPSPDKLSSSFEFSGIGDTSGWKSLVFQDSTLKNDENEARPIYLEQAGQLSKPSGFLGTSSRCLRHFCCMPVTSTTTTNTNRADRMTLPASHMPESWRQSRAVRNHRTARITRLKSTRKSRRGDSR